MCLKSSLRSSLFIWYLLFAEHVVTPFDFSLQKLVVISVSSMRKNLDWFLASFVSFLTDPEHCKKQERIVFFMESPCFSKTVLPKMFPFFVFFPNDSFFPFIVLLFSCFSLLFSMCFWVLFLRGYLLTATCPLQPCSPSSACDLHGSLCLGCVFCLFEL